MLGDAHGIDDAGLLGLPIGPGSLDQVLCGDSRDLFHPLRRVLGHHLFQLVKLLGPPGDELLIGQALGDDDIHHAVQPGHVGAGPLLQVQVGQHGGLDGARIDDDHLGAVGLGPHDARGDQRVGLAGIRPGDQDTVGMLKLGDRVGHCPTAKRGDQTGHRGTVSKAGAVIDVVRSDHGPRQFLYEIVLLIGALGRGQHADGVGAMLGLDRSQLFSYKG